MKPDKQKTSEWYADPMFLIPVCAILMLFLWTIFRQFGY